MEKIETERLVIRRFLPDDWQDLYEYLSDREVVKYEPYDVFTMEDCITEASNRIGNPAFRAVCLKEGGKLIGNLYFNLAEPEFSTWELGYVFNAQYQRKGYATESCMTMLGYAFERLNARRVIALCNPDNSASWKLMERLGMRREGHLIQNIYFTCDTLGNPVWQDTFEYAILVDEWRRSALPQWQGKTGREVAL